MLSLERLRVLIAIAEAQSLAGAGRSLYLSQPTVSHHLDALEASMGVRLVERRPNGSRLTEMGTTVVAQARSILDRVADLEGEVRTLREHGMAVVNIASFPSAASVLLPGPLAALRQEGLPFRLTVVEPPELAFYVGERGLDVALLYSEQEARAQAPEWLETERLLDDPLLVLLASGHELAHRPHLELSELTDESWITTTVDTDPEHVLLVRAFAMAGREPVFTLRADDFHVKQQLVAAGLGVSLIPQIAVPQIIEGVVARPVLDAGFGRRIDVGWRQNRPAAVARLVEHLRREAGRFQTAANAISLARAAS